MTCGCVEAGSVAGRTRVAIGLLLASAPRGPGSTPGRPHLVAGAIRKPPSTMDFSIGGRPRGSPTPPAGARGAAALGPARLLPCILLNTPRREASRWLAA
jgi:hypothetical protein